MGCAASVPGGGADGSLHGGLANGEKDSATKGKSPYGPLSSEQYQSRLAHSGSVRETKVSLSPGGPSYTLRWAYASQRGYYPDHPHKVCPAGRGCTWGGSHPVAPPLNTLGRRTRTRSARSPTSAATRAPTSSACSTATARRARPAPSSPRTRHASPPAARWLTGRTASPRTLFRAANVVHASWRGRGESAALPLCPSADPPRADSCRAWSGPSRSWRRRLRSLTPPPSSPPTGRCA